MALRNADSTPSVAATLGVAVAMAMDKPLVVAAYTVLPLAKTPRTKLLPSPLAVVQPGYFLPAGELDARQQTTELKSQNAELKQELSTLEAPLTALEERPNSASPASNAQPVMLALGMLVMLGVVYLQHRANRGGR